MKKSYIIGLLSLVMVGVFSFLVTYRYADSEIFEDHLYENHAKDEIVPVEEIPTNVITNKTVYILEKYNKDNDSLEEEYLSIPVEFLGLNREGLLEYIKNYEKNPDYHDIDMGFVSYDLLSFSRECIVLRKTYMTKQDSTKYFLVSEDKYVTVYYSDLKTVYMYTDIKIENLPENIGNEITKGKYVKDVEELCNFLESYSS